MKQTFFESSKYSLILRTCDSFCFPALICDSGDYFVLVKREKKAWATRKEKMEEDDSKTIHVAGEMSQTVEPVFNGSGFEMDLDPRNNVTENLPKILNEEDIKIELISQDGTVETIGTISRLDGRQNLREIGPDCGRSVADEDVQMPNIEEFDEDSVTFKVDSQECFHTDFHINQLIISQ